MRLSTSGATSTAALYLAERENAADLVGGVSLSDKDDVLAGVLADLSMTSTLDTSLKMGDKVLRNMDGITNLHKTRVEQAGFAVLKSPDIPSILVETGFISNPQESSLLATEQLPEENGQRHPSRYPGVVQGPSALGYAAGVAEAAGRAATRSAGRAAVHHRQR